MKLIRLRLRNFRQHADSDIVFRSGVTGIIGPNGAGKSTILEAIAWAVYGSTAARGTNDTIRFQRAPSRSRVDVELTFELGGHEYRVTRSLSGADVFIDGAATPFASGIGTTTDFLRGRLGMNRDEFFNTYFTGQKELHFLAQMGPTERGRFLNRLLGYERLRLAQDRVRARRGELRHELDGVRAGLGDVDAFEDEVRATEQRLAESTRELDAAESTRIAAAEALIDVVPRWTAIQTRRDEARELTHAIEAAHADVDRARRDLERAETALEAVRAAESELAPLRAPLAQLTAVVRECDELADLARIAERRGALEDNARALATDLEQLAARLEAIGRAPELVRQYTDELDAARAELSKLDAVVEDRRTDWSARRQEVRTRRSSGERTARELEDRIADLREAGPDGACPTCQRPLGAEFDNVVGRLEDELYTLRQDGSWLARRELQLEKKPEDLVEAEEKRGAARELADEHAQRLARCEQAVQELWTLASERKQKKARLASLQAELESLPTGYDPALHRASEARLRALREVETRATRLAALIEDRDARVAEADAARRRAAEAEKLLARTEFRRAVLGYHNTDYETTRREHDAAAQALHRAELHAVEAAGRVEAAEEAGRSAARELRSWRERRALADDLEIDLRHHNELDGALSRLRTELNARVRPELGELASRFLADITDGRYTSIEIDESYNVLVMDEGEEKPVISGGEEDVANLVLRLAISQMIAERAGQQLSILILDEVFGSLDVDRRDNVIQLLRRLGGRFEQVILITHVETIREGLDNVLRVGFDERTGASTVVEESVAGRIRSPQLVN